MEVLRFYHFMLLLLLLLLLHAACGAIGHIFHSRDILEHPLSTDDANSLTRPIIFVTSSRPMYFSCCFS